MVTLARWGEVTSGANLTICGVWGDMVDVILCAIFGDCRLRGVGWCEGQLRPLPLTWRVALIQHWVVTIMCAQKWARARMSMSCDIIHINQWRSDTFGRPVLSNLLPVFGNTGEPIQPYCLHFLALHRNTATRSVSQHKASNFHFQFQSGRRLPWLRWHNNLSMLWFFCCAQLCLSGQQTLVMRQN